MDALVWLVKGADDAEDADKQENPGLAPSRSSGGSRAANAYDAPRKHGASIAAGTGNRKGRAASYSQAGCRGRAGFPATVTPAPTSRVTTLPAPIRAPSPMLTPGRMM